MTSRYRIPSGACLTLIIMYLNKYHSPIINICFVPAALVSSYAFQTAVEDSVSHIQGTERKYSSEPIQKRRPMRLLRSESCLLLKASKGRTAMYGEKSFLTSAPKLWNKLPNYIERAKHKETFMRFLKPTYLN